MRKVLYQDDKCVIFYDAQEEGVFIDTPIGRFRVYAEPLKLRKVPQLIGSLDFSPYQVFDGGNIVFELQ